MMRALSIALAALALSCGCGPAATPEAQPRLAFSHPTRDDPLATGSDGAIGPLAVGASMEVTVHRRRAGSDDVTFKMGSWVMPLESDFERVPASSAVSSAPGVLRALVTPKGRLRVTGLAPGRATVTVQAGAVPGSIDLRVAAVARASIDHWSRLLVLRDRFAGDAAFVKGDSGRFIVKLYDAGGSRLVSSAMAPPIAIEPAGAATVLPVEEGDADHASVRFDKAGRIALLPRAGERLDVQVIDLHEVDAIDLVEPSLGGLEVKADWHGGDYWGRPPELVAVGAPPEPPAPPAGWRAEHLYGVMVRARRRGGGAVVLLGEAARVSVRSPDVCAIEPPERLWSVLGDVPTLIRTRAPGACEIEATLDSRSIRTTIAVSAKEGSLERARP